MWEYNGTKIFKKPENDQYVDGNVSLICITYYKLKVFKCKLRLLMFSINVNIEKKEVMLISINF